MDWGDISEIGDTSEADEADEADEAGVSTMGVGAAGGRPLSPLGGGEHTGTPTGTPILGT